MLKNKLLSAMGGAPANYIEDVFSTWLYTGNGSTQTINNGIDLAGKGGLVWIKYRNSSDYGTTVYDTVRGVNRGLRTNSTAAQNSLTDTVTAFNSNGFSLGNNNDALNFNGGQYVSWTFREQPKFFDVVTFTGNSASGRQISHSLGSAPGCIIVKNLTNADEWLVWHRSLGDFGGSGMNLVLNTTAAEDTGGYFGTASTQTSTYFTVNADITKINSSGNNYVAYLFAHTAGGFGLTGTDNVISCGSYTGSASDVAVTLGYEAQWVLVKNTTTAANWQILDIMRGMPLTGTAPTLAPNLSNAESNQTAPVIVPTATGFRVTGGLGFALNYEGDNYIYIAIRRGPMKVPTTGTSVYQAVTRTGNSPTVNTISSVGFAPDAVWQKRRSPDTAASNFFDKLRGRFFLSSATTSAETAANTTATRDLVSFNNLGFTVGEQWSSELNANTKPEVYWALQRAPGFFDEVCYLGTGSATTQAHNLGVVPEMMIIKERTANYGGSWRVYVASLGNSAGLVLNDTSATFGPNTWLNNTTPTASVFSLSGSSLGNGSGSTYVNYLFATCPGVSKVGSYTGTGTTQTINCGFTAGSRFVLIKRTDSTGDWYVWDSARGIVSGNDPYLLLNSTAAEVTNTDFIDTAATGFEISSTAPAAINASGGTFIFLAIA